jgi:hypothetical protein
MQADRQSRRSFGAAVVLRPVLGITVCVVLALALFAGSALASKPKSGYWGLWGGNSGPVGGSFQVAGHQRHFHLTTFGDDQTCLMSSTGADNFWINTKIPVTTAGSFSFTGSATADGTSAVPVTLSGKFTSPTTAKVTFTVSASGCTQTTVTIHHDPVG